MEEVKWKICYKRSSFFKRKIVFNYSHTIARFIGVISYGATKRKWKDESQHLDKSNDAKN